MLYLPVHVAKISSPLIQSTHDSSLAIRWLIYVQRWDLEIRMLNKKKKLSQKMHNWQIHRPKSLRQKQTRNRITKYRLIISIFTLFKWNCWDDFEQEKCKQCIWQPHDVGWPFCYWRRGLRESEFYIHFLKAIPRNAFWPFLVSVFADKIKWITFTWKYKKQI